MLDERPDAVIVATGAAPLVPPVPGLRAWAKRELHVAQAPDQAALAPLFTTLADATRAPPAELRETLEGLAAWYLTRAWENGQACDPVARFHLGNGARLERINWSADPSPRGVAQSIGLMVNYVYDLDQVERNHEEYVNRHHVAASATVERLARNVEALMVERPDAAPISTS